MASRLLLTSFLFAGLGTAAKVGLFESDACVDSSGMEQCYNDAEAAWADCVNENCEDQNIDCHNVCACIQVSDQIDCAGRHCWNEVYSCEYQQTVGQIGEVCIKPDFSDIPFYPPPDDAPGACSCNLGKLTNSLYKTVAEIDSCGANGEDIIQTLTSNDEIQAFTKSCQCCSQSALLSAFWGFCPTTSPTELGIDDIYYSLVASNDDWPQCKEYMDAYPCGSELGYSTPGNDSDAVFYYPESFPENGTSTVFNLDGVITAPVSGETYTWTFNEREPRTITVASADAKPTSKTSDTDDNDGENDKAEGDSKENEDDEDSAVLVAPSLIMFLVGVVVLI